jgi:GNAT superfamily N-acetyltransferase
LGSTPENFAFAADYILKDINYGFFVYAYNELDNTPLGFMLFTYEWSDWRNGLFFWLQSVHVADSHRREGVFQKMSDFLDSYMKERGSCGIRLYYEKEHRDKWTPIIKKLKLTESHYYIFHVDNNSVTSGVESEASAAK